MSLSVLILRAQDSKGKLYSSSTQRCCPHCEQANETTRKAKKAPPAQTATSTEAGAHPGPATRTATTAGCASCLHYSTDASPTPTAFNSQTTNVSRAKYTNASYPRRHAWHRICTADTVHPVCVHRELRRCHTPCQWLDDVSHEHSWANLWQLTSCCCCGRCRLCLWCGVPRLSIPSSCVTVRSGVPSQRPRRHPNAEGPAASICTTDTTQCHGYGIVGTCRAYDGHCGCTANTRPAQSCCVNRCRRSPCCSHTSHTSHTSFTSSSVMTAL